ncbi:MAG TPA: hypothetical protein VMT86_20400 [Bryobacteraceae bacterium]|nr:hypothetical protein [Bryobacteraceae bacterium]
MHKPALTSLAFLLVLTWQPVFACKCAASASVCNAVAASDVIFIGAVESVEPRSLYDPTKRRLWELTQEEIKGAEGWRTRFKVKETFRGAPVSSVEVWSELSDCGFAFQIGETYLVYASRNETEHRLETSVCSRTCRLSDAGADLAYLFFLKHGGAESGRLTGFVTSDRLDVDTARFWDFIHHPARNILLEIEFDKSVRYTSADQQGRFTFDGLPAGDYRISAFRGSYPEQGSMAAAPRTVHLKPNGCVNEVILVQPGSH